MKLKDQRHFRRYPRDADLTLKFKNKYFKAKMVNYSPAGLGAIMANTAPVVKGDIVEITADEPVIRICGEIVRSVIENSILMFGIKNIMGMEGQVKDYRLPDVLLGLQRGLRTGVLTVKRGRAERKIYIRNGDLIFSASNQDEDRMGDILLREGKINKEQYDQSVIEMKRTGNRQGMILVRLGYLSPEALINAVQYQVEYIIESLFALEESDFKFEERPLPTEEVITLKLSAANLIYRGTKKINNLGRIQKELPAMESVLSFATDPLNLFQDLRLDEAGRKTISFVDGKTAINDIIPMTQLGNIEALRTIYALLSVRTLEVQEAGTAVEVPEDEVKEMQKDEKKKITEPITQEMIEDMLQRCESLDHYGVLGVETQASVAEIKAAYYKAAKKYHPDMHFYLIDNSLKDKLSDIFSYIYEAYAALASPQKRSEYDKHKSVKRPGVTAAHNRGGDAFEEGKLHLKRKNYQEAERLLGQAAYFDPAQAEYHYYYGLTLALLNRSKEAVEAFEAGRRLEPGNAAYLSELGFVYLALGYPTRAKRLFERALSISPDNARAAEGLNKSKGALGR